MSIAVPDTGTAASPNAVSAVDVAVFRGPDALRQAQALASTGHGAGANPSFDLRWLPALAEGLRHVPLLLVASREGQMCGHLPLLLVRSLLFGRHLVSLPYLSSAGAQASDNTTSQALIDHAIDLAHELQARQLQLRHETAVEHPHLTTPPLRKVHMRRILPEHSDQLWSALGAKVRNQVRKGEKHHRQVEWGSESLLTFFYDVFSRNMRDLGTPVFPRRLFQAILRHFGADAELAVVWRGQQPVAAAIVVHGAGMTQVLSASSLRSYNHECANMLLYWHLLQRAIVRGQRVFDFGRSTLESSTYRFKAQWGANPEAADWQFYLRRGRCDELRPERPAFQWATRVWRRLPLGLTRCLGPMIVRGIP